MNRYLVLFVFICVFSLNAFGEQLLAPQKALEKAFRKATAFEQDIIRLSEEEKRQIEDEAEIVFNASQPDEVILYKAYNGKTLLGYAFEDTVIGKWGPIHYLVSLHKDGSIAEVVILDYEEIRGRPVAKKRFLRQYRGKTKDDPLRIRRDINGVTGATITSRSLTDGVRKITHIFHQRLTSAAR